MGKKLLNTHCKRNIYFSHIHSHLTYGILMWGSMASESQLNGLRKIQDHCIRIVSSNYNDNIKDLYSSLKIQSVDQLIKGSLCKLGHNLNHKQLPSPLIKLFNMHGGGGNCIGIQQGTKIFLTFKSTLYRSLIEASYVEV